MQAPAGYVAGLGRGASGFTTRADIGPARLLLLRPLRKGKDDDEGNAAGGEKMTTGPGGEEGEGIFRILRNETGLFAGAVYEKDEEEADLIWKLLMQGWTKGEGNSEKQGKGREGEGNGGEAQDGRSLRI